MKSTYLLAGASTALAMFGALSVGPAVAQTTLNIATVNNSDMIIMQKLSPKFEAATGIKLNWVVLEENVLRQRVTTDIATKGGQFDIITIGAYETPIWGKLGWLDSVDDLGDAYDYNDLIPQVTAALSAPTARCMRCRSTPKARSRSIARTCSTRPASRCRTSRPTTRSPTTPRS